MASMKVMKTQQQIEITAPVVVGCKYKVKINIIIFTIHKLYESGFNRIREMKSKIVFDGFENYLTHFLNTIARVIFISMHSFGYICYVDYS